LGNHGDDAIFVEVRAPMPELPEVETLRRSLAPRLVGRRIEAVRVRQAALRVRVSRHRLVRCLVGRRVEALRRRAKYLLAQVEGGGFLLVHLGMSGTLLLRPAGMPLEKHEHIVFALDDGAELRFRDPRRFGLVDTIAAGGLAGDVRLRGLGIEPLSRRLTGHFLYERSRGRRKPVKNFIMDARELVGVGNIYANEALFDARIHPRRAAGRISLDAWERLARSLKHVLVEAIRSRGTTISDFRDAEGKAGSFQTRLLVYHRQGAPCLRCSAPLRSIVLGGRSTFYCARCQR
jgi:formamidopyrimidine-DNA glycosylase